MIIYAYAHDDFNSYADFMRGLTVAIETYKNSEDNRIDIWCGGPHMLNDFTAEYCNRTSAFFKQKKIKIKYHRVPKQLFLDELDKGPVEMVLYFSAKEYNPYFDPIMSKAENMEIPTRIYK